MTSPLQERMIEMIKTTGAMPVDQYMKLCLTDPDHGYYCQQNPLGAEGDFTTAPEISQIFGELVGLWLYDEALKQGIADSAILYELGPGRGTLMADVLRTYAAIDNNRSWDVYLAEINPVLIETQKAQIAPLPNATPNWCQAKADLPPSPVMIIANEFFDALPVRQFKSLNGQWHECLVDVENGQLTRTTAPSPAPEDLGLPDPSEESLTAELCPDLDAIITPLAEHIATYGGTMLIIDYGKAGMIGDSVQAVQAHRPVDILHEPGQTDLSAWVDFNAIATIARTAGISAYGPVEQGHFLKSIGLYQRAEQLAIGAETETRRQIAAAVDRLSSPAQMGTAFKVMALRPDNIAEPVAGM